MAKQRTAHAYEIELRKMIKSRTGKDMELWLMPQVRATAANMVILDKIQCEILETESLVVPVPGSMGQMKNEVSPLLPHYDKCQRTLMMQLEALGLNYSTPTSKLTADPSKERANKKEALAQMLADANESMTEIPED